MKSKKSIAVVIGLLVIVPVAFFSVIHIAAYWHGRSRAQNDLEHQTYSFPEGHGYQPASTFSDGVAYLYVGYPQDDWAGDTRLSNRYVAPWIAGYQSVVEDAGYALQRTEKKPALLGMQNSK